MNDVTTLRIDLGISAKKIASQLMINNQNLEENISKGIQKAIDELSAESSFEEMISESTKKAIQTIVHESILGWQFREKVRKIVDEKIDSAIGEYGEKLAYKLIGSLDKD